jgi:hypothetical protein
VPPARTTAWGDSLGSTAVGSAAVPVEEQAVPADDRYDEPFVLDDDLRDDELDDLDDDGPHTETELTAPSARRRLVVIGLPILALALVVGLAWWFGNSVLSVAGNYDDLEGSTPSSSAAASTSASGSESEAPATGGPVEIDNGTVYDPGGDGAPENNDQVPQSIDGDPATVWKTLTYQGSPAFGNLKDGVGIVYDLGSEQELVSATVETTRPGSTVEIRAASGTEGELGDWPLLAEGELEKSTDFSFEEPATTRYVLVWVTGLVEGDGGFEADLAEVTVQAAA